ncbi:MAG: dephospho-CoA kinase [bacterium]
MKLIGLTGTIGSGKSAVATMLASLGAYIIDADEIAREVVLPGTQGLNKIVETWGAGLLDENGTLDRDRLARIVFKDEEQRKKLNGILHPLIMLETQKRISDSDAQVVVLVVPLLFESGMDRIVSEKWVVTAPEETLARRICERDGCEAEHARDRIGSQMSQREKIALADVVIDNGGTLEQTRKLAEEAWNKIEKF